MRALIAGAGFVGSALAQRLADAGDEVFALRRSERPSSGRVTWLRGDLRDPTTLSALPGGCDIVFFCAGPDGASDATIRGGNKRCRSTRLQATGFTLTYPTFREGYAAMLDPA